MLRYVALRIKIDPYISLVVGRGGAADNSYRGSLRAQVTSNLADRFTLSRTTQCIFSLLLFSCHGWHPSLLAWPHLIAAVYTGRGAGQKHLTLPYSSLKYLSLLSIQSLPLRLVTQFPGRLEIVQICKSTNSMETGAPTSLGPCSHPTSRALFSKTGPSVHAT